MANFTELVPGTPFFMENLTGGAEITYSANDFRTYTHAFHQRQGVLGAMDFWVYQADNVGYAIKVIAGSAIVGNYVVTLPQNTTIPLEFAKNPGTTCVHKVYLVVNDEAYNANAVGYEAHIQGMESVNGAVPPLPTFSAGYIELCAITYKPGQPNVQNKDILNTRQHGGGSGTFGSLVGYLKPPNVSAHTTSPGRPPFGARLSNGRVYFSGATAQSGGTYAADGKYLIGTMPGALWPKYQQTMIGATDKNLSGGFDMVGKGPYTFVFTIGTDGTLNVQMPYNNAATFLFFDGLSYDLD